MHNNHDYCVILAGGSGTHFWPMCRDSHPKQFHIANESKLSFLQLTYQRMLKLFDEDHIYISSLTKYKDLIFEQLPDIPEDRLMLEPYGRNTAPTMAFATYTLLAKDPDAVMAVTPCDQLISDTAAFGVAIREGLDYARNNSTLLTLGIVPSSPNTNYGYVQVEGPYAHHKAVKAKTFTEKPPEELAKVFVESGEFLWNSGIFFWKAAAIREEMHKCCPEITRLWKGWDKELGSLHELRFIERVYTESPNISIDYAVLEKSENLFVLPSDFGWSDVTDWTSFYQVHQAKDENQNIVLIKGKSFLKDNSNSIIYGSDPKKLVVARGLEGFMVIDTEDALLICPRDEATLKSTLSALKGPEYEEFK